MTSNALPRPGDLVSGKYRIDSVIGEGGMGVVLGATDMSLGRPVAIKFLAPARAANEAAAARFSREARAAASIQSEHVVRVYEVGTGPNNAPYIVMEHLRGSDLATLIEQRGALPFDYACDLVLQVCEALGDAHARGIVHRDLKPQNLFLTQKADGSPCVKVLDFGISKVADGDTSAPNLTSTDMVMGTPLYMSPEQVRSVKNVDARADIWALGTILHELVSGSPPFDGPTASALHAAIAMDPPPPLRTLRPDAPAALEAIILHCLEKSPAHRFQSVGELADALRPYATQIGQLAASRVLRVQPAQPPVIVSVAPSANMHGSTMQGWNQTQSSPQGAAPKKSSLGLILGLVFGALFVIGTGIALVAIYLRERRTISVSNAVSTSASATPAEKTSAASIVPDVVPVASASATARPPHAPHPVAVKDGGAIPPPDSSDDRRSNYARQVQPVCDQDARRMSLGDDASRRNAATDVKMRSCRGKDAVRCERDNCRTACTMLSDTGCLQLLADTNREFPTKY